MSYRLLALVFAVSCIGGCDNASEVAAPAAEVGNEPPTTSDSNIKVIKAAVPSTQPLAPATTRSATTAASTAASTAPVRRVSNEPVQAPVGSYERFPTPAGEKPKFSGKVVGAAPEAEVEVALVSLVGVYWTKKENVEWFSVEPDGTFSIEAVAQPTVKKTLAARTPARAWAYLPADFEPNESARNIELVLPPTTPSVISVADADGVPKRGFNVEIFSPARPVDSIGNTLTRRRYGQFWTPGDSLQIELPRELTAILVSSPNLAPDYQIVDPRTADGFHFQLLKPGVLNVLVTRDGKPVAGQRVMVTTEGAPLSASGKTTDASGRFTAGNRVPGTNIIHIGDKHVPIELKPGETKETTVDLTGQP